MEKKFNIIQEQLSKEKKDLSLQIERYMPWGGDGKICKQCCWILKIKEELFQQPRGEKKNQGTKKGKPLAWPPMLP